ncbi:unannotated protein [freshwater metagenome]|uniref:Unannotated protein n=1 Tax=freshwater metagenome TaxID=449393 RepID=A0A6J6EKZ4_9ZZZZ
MNLIFEFTYGSVFPKGNDTRPITSFDPAILLNAENNPRTLAERRVSLAPKLVDPVARPAIIPLIDLDMAPNTLLSCAFCNSWKFCAKLFNILRIVIIFDSIFFNLTSTVSLSSPSGSNSYFIVNSGSNSAILFFSSTIFTSLSYIFFDLSRLSRRV